MPTAVILINSYGQNDHQQQFTTKRLKQIETELCTLESGVIISKKKRDERIKFQLKKDVEHRHHVAFFYNHCFDYVMGRKLKTTVCRGWKSFYIKGLIFIRIGTIEHHWRCSNLNESNTRTQWRKFTSVSFGMRLFYLETIVPRR